MCATWNKDYDPELVAQTLESIRITDVSGKLTGFRGFKYEDCVTVLHSSLLFSEKIPEIERRRIINLSVRSVAEKEKLSASSLLREISKQENTYIRRPKSRYILMSTISAHFSHKPRRTAILGCPIILTGHPDKRFNTKSIVKRARPFITGDLPNDYYYVRVFVDSRSEYEAFSTALDSLDVLRGIWNLFNNHTTMNRSSTSRRKPINEVLLGPIHTLHKTDGSLAGDNFWYEPDYAGPARCLNLGSRWQQLHKFEKHIRSKLLRSAYKPQLEDIIRRYTRTLDMRDFKAAFINLWSLLETLTSTLGDRYDETIKRTIFLLKDRKFNQQILNHLRNYRNRAVHSGEGTEEIESLLFQLKRYVEILMDFHISNVYGFKSIREAGEFLALPTDTTLLKNRVQLMQRALKLFA